MNLCWLGILDWLVDQHILLNARNKLFDVS